MWLLTVLIVIDLRAVWLFALFVISLCWSCVKSFQNHTRVPGDKEPTWIFYMWLDIPCDWPWSWEIAVSLRWTSEKNSKSDKGFRRYVRKTNSEHDIWPTTTTLTLVEGSLTCLFCKSSHWNRCEIFSELEPFSVSLTFEWANGNIFSACCLNKFDICVWNTFRIWPGIFSILGKKHPDSHTNWLAYPDRHTNWLAYADRHTNWLAWKQYTTPQQKFSGRAVC